MNIIFNIRITPRFILGTEIKKKTDSGTVSCSPLLTPRSVTEKMEASAQLDHFLSFCHGSIIEFILVKSTFDVTSLYNQ